MRLFTGPGCSKQDQANPGLASNFNSVLLPSDEDSCKSFVPYVLTVVVFKQPLEISSENFFYTRETESCITFLTSFRTTGP